MSRAASAGRGVSVSPGNAGAITRQVIPATPRFWYAQRASPVRRDGRQPTPATDDGWTGLRVYGEGQLAAGTRQAAKPASRDRLASSACEHAAELAHGSRTSRRPVGVAAPRGELRDRGGVHWRRASETAQDASDIGARLARPIRRSHGRAGVVGRRAPSRCRRPRARAARASGAPGPRSPDRARRGCARAAGSRSPAQVAGMNCAMPCAPAGERAEASKPLSASSCAASSAGGSCSARAARAISGRSAAGT